LGPEEQILAAPLHFKDAATDAGECQMSTIFDPPENLTKLKISKIISAIATLAFFDRSIIKLQTNWRFVISIAWFVDMCYRVLCLYSTCGLCEICCRGCLNLWKL